ncbi:uncharacterized protein DEA37_0003326 [Paragonimus westermani]|uniref:Integrase catalytic domain-containing protein n=1 Tax=Paragonimus westermani TaxID=34504 RepID=A0A5J4NSU6_9TREM|nr:uncharacterized protein DEA37_0003326 [Paragonimus westermani]
MVVCGLRYCQDAQTQTGERLGFSTKAFGSIACTARQRVGGGVPETVRFSGKDANHLLTPNLGDQETVVCWNLPVGLPGHYCLDQTGKSFKMLRRLDHIRPSIRLSGNLEESQLNTMIKDTLNKRVIRPSTSPWASPIVLVKKKDDSLRLCVDYRLLNAITKRDSFPLPRIDTTLDALHDTRWFSTSDLASGYWQVERLMQTVLQDLVPSQCLIYLDDINVHAPTIDEHNPRLKNVFEHLRMTGLKLKHTKCVLLKQEVSFLGHLITPSGVKTDGTKVKQVVDWLVPRSVNEVRSFRGLASYYRKFVSYFAEIASPLYQLTEKGKKFLWSAACHAAFNTLEDKLSSPLILAFPDFPPSAGPFILDTDASDLAIGAVVSQKSANGEVVIAYASRRLDKRERCISLNTSALTWETLKVRTDHQALQWLRNFREPEGQVERWLEYLQDCNFDCIYRPGSRHANADALSHFPMETVNAMLSTPSVGATAKRTYRLIVPSGKVSNVVREVHVELGHSGQRRTEAAVRQLFWWSKLHDDVVRNGARCNSCAQTKSPTVAPRAPLQKVATLGPNHCVGPIPTSRRGSKYILVIVDYFTKWCEALPIPNQEASTITSLFVNEWVARSGTPIELHPDQGAAFESRPLEEACRMLHIHKTLTTPYHRQSNGLVERTNRTVMTILRAFIHRWDEILPQCLLAYRAAVHSSTGYTPLLLTLEHQLRLPNELKPAKTPEEAQMRPLPVPPGSVPIAEQTVEIPAEVGCSNIGGAEALGSPTYVVLGVFHTTWTSLEL